MSWNKLLEEQSAIVNALDVVGDRWSLMIIAGCLASVYRFNQLEQALGINRNLLSSRLNRLIEAGILEKHLYQDKPKRYEYRITPVGLALRPVIVGLASWSEEHLVEGQAPITVVHKSCGGDVTAKIHCPKCDNYVSETDVTSRLNESAGPESTRVYGETWTQVIPG